MSLRLSRRLGSGAVASACVLITALPDALAFCRTTTVKAPADYDAAGGAGCFAEGVPLFWRNACLGYSMQSAGSRRISYEEASGALSTAFTRWTGATCPTNGRGRSRTSIDVRDLGPAECAKVEYKSGVANQNVIVFRDETWKYGSFVLGLTTVSYNTKTGEIYSADMELNTLDMDPLAVSDSEISPGDYDFASVVTHEAGHFLGLAHSDVEGSTMLARYEPGQTFMRDLSPDDVAAICTVYQPDGNRAVFDGKVTQAPQCNPTPRGGFSSECQEKKKPGCASSTSPSGPTHGLDWALALAGAIAVRRTLRRRPLISSEAPSSSRRRSRRSNPLRTSR